MSAPDWIDPIEFEVEDALRALNRRSAETLLDVCGCPGLFAGQYDAIERVPRGLIEYRGEGIASFFGLRKAFPTELGEIVAEQWEQRQ